MAPLLIAFPLTSLHPKLRQWWLTWLAWGLRWCGPAFTKWGQWAAGRPDLLPADIRQVLETLHTNAPTHSKAATLAALQHALPAPLEVLFDELVLEPEASGAIAQVHRAKLSAQGADLCGALPGQVCLLNTNNHVIQHQSSAVACFALDASRLV